MIAEFAPETFHSASLLANLRVLRAAMAPRLNRALLLSVAGVVGVWAVLLQPPSRREPFAEFSGKPAAYGRWIDSSSPSLVIGNSRREVDRTIQRLEATILEEPGDSVARSNLAVALMTRAEQEDRAVDLVAAVEQLEIALQTAPEKPEVLYNHAAALTRLGLRIAARRAWRRYLGVEPASRWSAGAWQRLEELQQPTLFKRWEEGGRNELRQAAELGDVDAAVALITRYPTFARGWIEERLLPSWAEAQQAGTLAAVFPRLETLHLLGNALAEAIHDHTVADTLALIDGTSEPPRLLVEGLRTYGEAMKAYRGSGGGEGTNALLDRATDLLERAGSPLSGWTRLYRAVGWHWNQPKIASQKLSDLAATTQLDRQPALVARIEWLLGTCEVIQNRYEQALAPYDRARKALTESEGRQAAAFIDLLIAEAQRKLGEVEQGWAARVPAIRSLAVIGDPQRLHAALYETVEVLFLEQRVAAAEPWVQELEANAPRWGTGLGLAEAALQRARLLAEKGRTTEAEESFSRARAAAEAIGDSNLRQRTQATIDLYEAEGLLGRRPEIAARYLERARPLMLQLAYRFQLPRLDWARARASLAQGDQQAAVAALRSSIAEEELIRREVRNESARASAFEGAQRSFDTLLELELKSSDGHKRAFAYAEQSRARVLLDLLDDDVPHRPGLEPTIDLDRLVAELPEGTDFVEFAVLPHELVGWWVRSGQSRLFRHDIDASALRRQVDRFRSAILQDASEPTIRRRASKLWRILLGPIAGQLQSQGPLVIVPDRFLAQVPFAVLLDPRSQRYLVEDHRITVAPSASAFLTAQARRRTLAGGPPSSIVAVGANHPDQTRLPTVESEAKAVAGLYPQRETLTGSAATQGAFLEASLSAEVLHFGGHAKEDLVAPRRSRIFFHPAGPDDPGLLFSQEIAAKRLPRTRVAVVAACRSLTAGARGRETFSGVAGAFLAAGVPTVVASLWDAEDQATGEIMTAFHGHLRRGRAPSEALRRSQINMLRPGSRFRSPRYWAGFAAVGAE